MTEKKLKFCGFLRCQQSETPSEKSQGKNRNKNKAKQKETQKKKKIINTHIEEEKPKKNVSKTFYAASKHVILIIFVVAELLFLKIIEF